ncbi:hypothetical protein BZG17_33640, partial [Escherichia coli]|nr:hypothetical protein [Escherichia coli]
HYHLVIGYRYSSLRYQKELVLLHRHLQIDQRYWYYHLYWLELPSGQMGFDRHYLVHKGY